MDAAVVDAVNYLGTVANKDELDAKATGATQGDFVCISISFDDYHAGDLFIWHKEEGVDGEWKQIRGEEGDITEVIAGEGLTSGSSTKVVTLSIKNAGVTTDKNVTETKLEQNVQDALALVRTALQEHQDIGGKKTSKKKLPLLVLLLK